MSISGVAVLAAAARLADKLAHAVRLLGDGFAVGDLRLARIGLDLELTEEAVADDFEVELAHARDEGLARFGIALDDECRVFLSQALEGYGKLFLVGLALGLDAHRDNRIGECRGLEANFVFAVAKSVAVTMSLAPIMAQMEPL